MEKSPPVQPEVMTEEDQDAVRDANCELLREAAGLQGPSLMTIHETGIDDGMAYYVTSLNDGEFVQDYVSRRGAMPTVTALALVKQLLQDLEKASEQALLVHHMRLDRVLVASPEEEHLQLRVFDYGLSQRRAAAAGQNGGRLVAEACRLLFLLLTGQVYAGGNPDTFGVIAELPANLRFVIKTVLAGPKAHSISLKTLRDEVREALCLNVNLVQARNPKMLLGADSTTLPISHLQKLLLGDIPLKTLFGASFRIENPGTAGCRPFAIPAVIVSTDQPVTLHLLPPERIVNQPDFMALPPQAWRYDPTRQTNILNMLSLWNGPDWSFVSEVREPGMTLSGLMARRGTLNPGEVITLLRQIQAGVEQALETGVQRADLDPASIHLCVGYDGPVLPRDLERLHQKRLDAWPKFVVKLRLHKTMRSLCKARLIDLSPWQCQPPEASDGFTVRDERHRTFIGLAAYLLTGEGQIQRIEEFPACVPEAAAGYLRECMHAALSGSPVPSPADFTEKLSLLVTPVSADSEEGEAAPIDRSQMESAGFVSDFEEDWATLDASAERSKDELLTPVSDDIRTLDFNQPLPPKPRTSWLALAATFAILGLTAWMVLGDLPASHSEKLTAVPSPRTRDSTSEPKIAESASKPEALPATPPQPIIHQLPTVLAEDTPVPPPAPAPAAPVLDATAPLPAPVIVQAAPPPAAPASAGIENAVSKEKRPLDTAPPVEAPKPRLVASASPSSNGGQQDTEPVVIRRAIATTSPAAPTPQKTLSKRLPMPKTSSRLHPANAPIPLTVEELHQKPPVPVSTAAPTLQSSPPADAKAADSVTIRHALVPSAEEIKQAIRPQGKSRTKKTTRR
ncbi:hypothetical protein [Prosthecobacter sp.]|uniref:hypothetical protein n=1 Tax=Prosthecobacter sp. TaxID=1965333 RepID=UPI003784CDDD